jgi:hypothetical protein
MARTWMIVFGLALIGSASSATTNPTNTDAGYYRNYTCRQLLEVGRQVSAQAVTLAGGSKHAHANDTASTEDSVAVPAFVTDTKPTSSELELVRKQLLAIEGASIQSQCAIEFLDSGR